MQNANFNNALSLVGRLLIALLFVPAGFGKLTGFEGTAGYIASAGLPLPQLGVVVAILAELGGGLLIAVGYKTRWAALALAVFTLVATVVFHAFWKDPSQEMMFMKNMAIIGGLLVLAASGAGAWSVDGKRNA